MAHYCQEPSRTFSEYLLIPGYTGPDCIPANVDLRTPLCKFKKGEDFLFTFYNSKLSYETCALAAADFS